MVEEKEMKKALKKMGFSDKTIKNYLSGEWGIPEEVKQKLKETEKNE